MPVTERERVASFGHPEDGLYEATPWYHWGLYLSERAWGTVREDYSSGGSAWDYFPHHHARSRAYRWGEDGMAGVSDVGQNLCMALALWNGRDPILKERMFGLTGPQGNHSEDAKDYWWYLDAVPSQAWLRWRYHYPQAEFPYADLVVENGRRDQSQPEYELLDTGVFDDDRYWVVDVVHAKADPHDLLMEISVTNAGPEESTLHVLPHQWFRNTWSWDFGAERPTLRCSGPRRVAVAQPKFGELTWELDSGPGGSAPDLLFCDRHQPEAAVRVAGCQGSFDEGEFLSPYGLRALSKYHEKHPLWVDLDGSYVSVDYERGESSTRMFGGNSNWRGPVWMPINYLLLRNLQRYARALGDELGIEYPTGSGEMAALGLCAEDLRFRLVSLFLRGPDGRRPCHGRADKVQDDARWRDNITFSEYFHGDNGAGLGASHQTGWTGWWLT